MLDLSARTLATLHSRTGGRRAVAADEPAAPLAEALPATPEQEGLRGLARRITGGKKRDDQAKPQGKSNGNGFELAQVLAAAEGNDGAKPVAVNGSAANGLKPNAAAALGALEAALADLAIDLDIVGDDTAQPNLWRRYLNGDRTAFARRLAQSIGPDTVDRIAGMYRDNQRFRDAANVYLQEFETLLAKARESDRDGLFASTLLRADTGKIYLAMAYSLGRLD
jgi:hypothetical protein